MRLCQTEPQSITGLPKMLMFAIKNAILHFYAFYVLLKFRTVISSGVDLH